MRQAGFRLPWSATVVLLVVNVVAFVFQSAVERFTEFPTYGYLALSVDGLRHGFVWQLVTYQFMHDGWLHLLLNCLAIYFLGPAVEGTLGRPRFLTLYFSTGVIGGLFQALAGLLLHGSLATQTVGASAGAYGLTAAFATLYPEQPLILLPLPVSLRAKFLLLFGALFAVFGIVFSAGRIAHAAHLGGMIAGVAFVRYAMHWHWHWPRFPQRRLARPLVRASRGGTGGWGRGQAADDEDLAPEEFVSKEVDPILDKISAQGIQSLTQRERGILEAAREKMARR